MTDELAPRTRLTAALVGDPNDAARDARANLEAARDAVTEADAQQCDVVRVALATGALSVMELAELLGVSRGTVYQICDGPPRLT